MRHTKLAGQKMGAKSTKPCGAYADLKELEYISALHQTGVNELRKDGSIQAIDIVHFLMSRYGIKVTEEEVREIILGAFGECSIRSEQRNRGDFSESAAGNGGDGEEDCLDLTQLLALLLVPLLLKAVRSLVQQKPTSSNLHSISSCDENELSETIDAETSGVTSPLLAMQQSSPQFTTQHFQCEKGDKRWPDSDLIDHVFRMMMHDATGDPSPKLLTKELIRQILCFYGDRDIADDERLLDEMMAAATANVSHAADAASDVEGCPVLFDQHAFARALTHDVRQYDIDNENRVTTNYYDVFQTCYSTKEQDGKKLRHRLTNPMKTVESASNGEDAIRPVQRVFTFPSIDYTAGTFRSKGFVILLWMTWILTYFAYLSSNDVLNLVRLKCDRTQFGCSLLQGIVNWLTIMVQLCILGTFILWASIGNSVYPTNPIFIVLGIGAVVLFVLLPYFKEFKTEVISTIKSGDVDQSLLYTLSLGCGISLILVSLINIFQRINLQRKVSLPRFAERFFNPGTVRLESQSKQASSFKANQLVRNACRVHKKAEFEYGMTDKIGDTKYETNYGKALLAYSKTVDETEESLGFLQKWRKIYSQELFKEDGICFTTHLLAGNVAQFTICLIVAAFFAQFYQYELFQEGLKYLDKLTQGSQRWRLVLSLFVGVISAEVTILIMAANYIPSTVRTMLQYRSGRHESLHSKKFLKLRLAVEQSTLIFGSIFWGSLFTSLGIGFFFMLLLGVFLWPDFAQVTVDIFANIIGIAITMLLKWLFLIGFRKTYQKAYYRRSVGLSNFVGVILESWNLGLTSSYMIIRGFKLLIAAIVYIGRVDIPFLSEDACFLGPFELDAYPLMFRKDLLAHEAHKHPYLERIGVMYMMKLRYQNFGNYAGTCWRLLFVHALLPWMRKYRNNEDNLGISDFKFAANRMWTGRMPRQSAFNEESDRLTSFQESHAPKESDGSITTLKMQNDMLKKENEFLRSLLFESRTGKEIYRSCPPRTTSKSFPDDHHASTNTL